MPPSVQELARAFPQLEVLEFIGKGGMGAVYKARQPTLDRFVALKILPPASGNDPGFAKRFNREARALARLTHPNIVAVHDFGQRGALHFLIMEFVDGANLRQVERAGRLAPEQALSIVPQICDALQFAHAEGIVHRDIKPENILLDKKGRVKITDFGIAKILGVTSGQAALTGAKDVVGTPHYMAPEQVEKPATVDHRADIYSLGVVFYEMLTGELPLGKFQPPSKKVQVDVRLDEVVLHALEKEPERRYQHASEVKTDVETIATGAQSEVRSPKSEISGQPAACAGRSPCYFSTPERMRNCFPSAAAQVFHCRGELRRTPEALTFVSPWQTRIVISLEEIEDLSIGQFQMWTTPWVMHYARVNFLSVTLNCDGRRQTVHLTPVAAEATSAQQINEQIGGWFEAIQNAVKARTGAVPHASEPRAVTFSAEPAWNRKGIPLFIAFLAVAGLFVWRSRSMFGSSPEPFGIALLVILGLLLVGVVWSATGFLKADAALKRGDLDAVTSNEPPEAILRGCAGTGAASALHRPPSPMQGTAHPTSNLPSDERVRLASLEGRVRALLWYGFIVSVFGLPAGLALDLPFVWALSIVGILICGYRLRSLKRTETDSGPPSSDAPGLRSPGAGEARSDAPPAGTALSPPRMSRLAVWGAIWFLIAVVADIWNYTPPGWALSRALRGWLGEFLGGGLGALLLVVGFAAPVGVTVLGWLALNEVRRSRGGVRGRALAFIEAVLFPLLALNAWWLWLSTQTGLKLALSVALALTVDVLAVHRLWRRVQMSLPARLSAVIRVEDEASASVFSQLGRVARRAVGVGVVLLLLLETLLQLSGPWRESTEELWTMALYSASLAAMVWVAWPLRRRSWTFLLRAGLAFALFVGWSVTSWFYSWHLRPNLGLYREAGWVAQHPGFQRQLRERIANNLWRKERAGNGSAASNVGVPGDSELDGSVAMQSSAARVFTFGETLDATLPFGVPCENHHLQFRSGRVFTIGRGPATTEAEYEEDWKRAKAAGGVDVSAGGDKEGVQFIGEGCIFTRERSPNWESTTAEEVLEQLEHASWVYGVVEPKTREFPLTYLFKTARGECGLLQLLEVIEDARVFAGSNRQGDGLKLRCKFVESASVPTATGSEEKADARRQFVRLVVEANAMTFEGQPTTWGDVGALLANVPNRPNTVLEFAVTSDQITVAQQNAWLRQTATLGREHGFAYTSFIGIHPLGSKGRDRASPAAAP